MAELKLTQLDEASNVASGDFFDISQLQPDTSYISKKLNYSNVVSGLSIEYIKLNYSNEIGATYTYNGDGTLATKTMAGVTYTYTYNGDGTLATKTDGTSTWTYNYTDGALTSKVKT